MKVLNVAKWQSGDVATPNKPSCSPAMKSNTRRSKITDSRPRNYGSFDFGDFVLKIGPNRRAKFGSAQKMLYLCIVITNGKMATREVRHRVSNTMKKNTQLWQRFCMK